MVKLLRRKYKIFNLYCWYIFGVRRNRKHWDLDRSVWWRYGWESDTMEIHDKLHTRFNLCARIFGNEANNYPI
jgi:hypothetical protein